MASVVLKAALAAPIMPPAPATDSSATAVTPTTLQTGKLIPLPDDDGDALLLILYILHFRNKELPAYIEPDKLVRIGLLANKYRCSQAISRATTQWFDRIYTDVEASKITNSNDVLMLIQAAYICDEAMYFARLTGLFVLTFPSPMTKSAAVNLDTMQEGIKHLKMLLHQRQVSSLVSLRLHLDLLTEPCAVALGRESHHYIDCPPDTDPEEAGIDTPERPAVCVVDSQAAPLYLAAMRNEGIWPSTTAWEGKTGQQVIDAIREFRVPEYDDSDKCDFCLPLVEEFAKKLMLVRQLQKDRLWGLCLDCINAGGINAGECRFAHVKGMGN